MPPAAAAAPRLQHFEKIAGPFWGLVLVPVAGAGPVLQQFWGGGSAARAVGRVGLSVGESPALLLLPVAVTGTGEPELAQVRARATELGYPTRQKGRPGSQPQRKLSSNPSTRRRFPQRSTALRGPAVQAGRRLRQGGRVRWRGRLGGVVRGRGHSWANKRPQPWGLTVLVLSCCLFGKFVVLQWASGQRFTERCRKRRVDRAGDSTPPTHPEVASLTGCC